MRYLALSPSESSENQAVTLWDIQAGRSLCSFPIAVEEHYPGSNYAQAFTEDETAFVEFSRGKAQCRDVLTGTIRQPKQTVIFPHDEDKYEANSRLVADGKGRLLVLVEEKNKPWSVRDLSTGEEVGSFSLPPLEDNLRPNGHRLPGLLLFPNPKNKIMEAREIPTGKILFQKVDHAVNLHSTEWAFDWTLTPDGKTKIEVDGQIHILDSRSGQRHLNLPGDFFPVLSFDGRYLLVTRMAFLDARLFWILSWFVNPEPIRQLTVLYDLEKEAEIASFALARRDIVRFSQDNRSLAILTDDLYLNIYDLPLGKPWDRIVGYALSVAGGVLLVGLVFSCFRRKQSKFSAAAMITTRPTSPTIADG